ncbi:MAG: EamA family transporter RarD, partial [Sinobacteraceae bacterium]|nr:EamA family transporter RarD [Nevskiaceae bacterium]
MKANRGLIPAASSFAMWGIFPLYFHALSQVPALQIIANRIAWSCVFVVAWILVRGELGLLRAALTDRTAVLRLTLTAALITMNWLAYVWGVTHGRVVETSLGYFIGPLVNVLLGVVLLSEKLTRTQWTAVALATLGVGYLTYMTGGLPWIALTLAFSFALYGFFRKLVKVEALPGLATETLLLAPLAVGYLLWC